MNTIVIGTDGSPGARAAVTHGLELARRLGTRVIFVFVRPDTWLLGDPYYQHRLSEQLARSRAALGPAIDEAEAASVEAEHEVVEGDTSDELIRAARYHDAELIVVGSRGLGALAGAVLGSTSARLVQHSPIPVLVVKEPAPCANGNGRQQVLESAS